MEVVVIDLEQGKITRIHDFCMNFEQLKARMLALKDKYPTGVIIPLHEKDLKSQVLHKIVEGLNECEYLKKVYIALSADETNYQRALKLAEKFEVPCEVVWCNRPEVLEILGELQSRGLDISSTCGKGRDLWLTIGIASLELYAFAVHDADIETYSAMLPTKLLYTVVEPTLDFWFSKGYYARVNFDTKTMYGRLYRLFVNPLLAALQKKLRHKSTFIRYLQSFRYPLSGEIAMYSDLALNLRIPADWGLEMGTLAELYRNVSNKRICEVDLGFFDHKHKAVSPNELLKTAEDSFITLLRTLTETEGINVSEAFLLSLQVTYRRFAQDRVRQYHADAMCNSLSFDRHEEETNVDVLSEVITRAGKRYLEKPTASQLPDWPRVISAMRDVRERLKKAAVER